MIGELSPPTIDHMEDHNLEEGTSKEDNAIDETVADTAAPQAEDTLLAGKFKSKEDLISSHAELVKQVEGRDLTPTEVRDLTKQEEKDLVNSYKGLERQFHTKRPSDEKETAKGEESVEVEEYLNSWAAKNGFVRKDELNAQEYEKQELEKYFTQNPSARNRQELIQRIAKMEGFTGKSFAEVDEYITQQVQVSNPNTTSTRPNKMGQAVIDGNKSLDDYSDDEFLEIISGGTGSSLRRS